MKKKPFVVDSASHVDELKAEIARMRPVFRAAMTAWRFAVNRNEPQWTEWLAKACARAARKATGKRP